MFPVKIKIFGDSLVVISVSRKFQNLKNLKIIFFKFADWDENIVVCYKDYVIII